MLFILVGLLVLNYCTATAVRDLIGGVWEFRGLENNVRMNFRVNFTESLGGDETSTVFVGNAYKYEDEDYAGIPSQIWKIILTGNSGEIQKTDSEQLSGDEFSSMQKVSASTLCTFDLQEVPTTKKMDSENYFPNGETPMFSSNSDDCAFQIVTAPSGKHLMVLSPAKSSSSYIGMRRPVAPHKSFFQRLGPAPMIIIMMVVQFGGRIWLAKRQKQTANAQEGQTAPVTAPAPAPAKTAPAPVKATSKKEE